MKCVILAGGFGTRISEETHLKPKPMVEIGGMPIIWHIMKIYSSYGINDFVICCGYKGYMIKEYFANYLYHTCDITFDLSKNNLPIIHNKSSEPWKVTLVDTGLETQTAGRLAKVKSFLGHERFCFTYGDGLSDINIREVINQHNQLNSLVTLTAIQPPGRFGSVEIKDNNKITGFLEKPAGDKSWVNGGFFVVEPDIFKFIKSSNDTWENDVIPKLAASGKVACYKHKGFWQCMDTLRDKNKLEKYWQEGDAPWKSW